MRISDIEKLAFFLFAAGVGEAFSKLQCGIDLTALISTVTSLPSAQKQVAPVTARPSISMRRRFAAATGTIQVVS